MLPPTPFPQLLLPRFAKALERLRAGVWSTDPAPLDVVQRGAHAQHLGFAEAIGGAFASVKQTPHFWGVMFDQCWWKVAVPKPRDGDGAAARYLRWIDQGEATVYLDGLPHYGIDPGHGHAPLPDGFHGELVVESLCARTGIWVTGEAQGLDPARGSRFDGAFLATRDDDAWHALHDLEVLMQVMELLRRPEYPADASLWQAGGYRPEIAVAEPLFRRLAHRVNRALDTLDRDGAGAFRAQTAAILIDLPAYPGAMKAVLTGHAHVDLVWLWPERAGAFKAVHSFANALRVMERYPEVTFGYSQPASYEAVARRSPALMERVRAQVASGRWEPTGALYVESDVQLPCGEALVRCFALGQAGFRDLRGHDSRCVWLPDVFGYCACLPTIMAGFGVPYFYTTKLHWSGATRFPYSSFKWVGMDGSEVVSHISWNHYNQEVTGKELRGAEDQHRQSAVHDEALFPCGYGDGGGGLTESMCERARRFADLSSMPRADWGTIEGFFDRLAGEADALPTWQGEMYLECHRGVQTTHGDLKAAFRAAERGLQVWEAVRCATGGGPVDEAPWKRLCFAQFHDCIPGSSIAEVYAEAVPELRGIADTALRRAGEELSATPADAADTGAEPCVFNPLAMPRRAVIGDRLVELPALAGVAESTLTPIATPEVVAHPSRLHNGRVDARFDAAGEIASLAVDGQAVQLAEPGAQLWTFDDVPAAYDAWDIDRHTLSQGRRHRGDAAVEVAPGVVTASVTFRRELEGVGRVAVRYGLVADSPVLRVDVDLALSTPQTLVKLVFPTRYRGREARYGGPFGSVKRPQWPGPLANEAMFENPASRWVCVADDTERDGLMMITESKYGVGCRAGRVHLSLARSARVTPANASATTTSLGGDPADGTFADLGDRHIRLAVGRFDAGAPRDQQPAALADFLFTPAVRYRGTPVSAGLGAIEGPASLVPAWAMPEPGGDWVLRLHETLGERGPVRLRLAEGRTARAIDLRGRSGAETMPGSVSPYALSSFRIGS